MSVFVFASAVYSVRTGHCLTPALLRQFPVAYACDISVWAYRMWNSLL